jgi:hypothetical protein
LIDEILQRLIRSPILSDCHVLQRNIAPDGEFVLKVRCHISPGLAFQVWVKQDPAGIRYSYQLFSRATILRWDNAPHFPDLENFPHHFHDTRGKRSPSKLIGDPLKDLSYVLREVEEYLETKT